MWRPRWLSRSLPIATRRTTTTSLRAYFTENRTISDYEVLAAIAEESGVDRAAFWSELDIGRSDAANAAIDEHNEAIEQGITAVPTVLASGFAVPGAQDVETYVRLFERMYAQAG